jgi:hypothetical protein
MFSNSRDFSLLARLPAGRGSIPPMGICVAGVSNFVKTKSLSTVDSLSTDNESAVRTLGVVCRAPIRQRWTASASTLGVADCSLAPRTVRNMLELGAPISSRGNCPHSQRCKIADECQSEIDIRCLTPRSALPGTFARRCAMSRNAPSSARKIEIREILRGPPYAISSRFHDLAVAARLWKLCEFHIQDASGSALRTLLRRPE